MKKALFALVFVLLILVAGSAFAQTSSAFNTPPGVQSFTVDRYKIPGEEIKACAVAGDTLYALGVSGLYRYQAEQESWQPLTLSIPEMAMRTIKAFDGELYVLLTRDISHGIIYNVQSGAEITVNCPNADSNGTLMDFTIDQDTIWVTTSYWDAVVGHFQENSGSGRQAVIVSYDRGATWQPASEGLETDALYCVDKGPDGKIYVCGNDGIFYRENSAWLPLPNKTKYYQSIVTDLSFVSFQEQDYLLAAVSGGVYIRNLTQGTDYLLRPDNQTQMALEVVADAASNTLTLCGWSDGLYTWALDQVLSFPSVQPKAEVRLLNVVYAECCAFLEGRIFVGGFDGYTAGIFLDPATGEYEIRNEGFQGFSGCRTAVATPDEVLCLSNNGIIRIDRETGGVVLNLLDWPLHEPWHLTKIDGSYYFQDYAFGIYKTTDFSDLTQLPLQSKNGQSLQDNAGGSSFYIDKENNRIYTYIMKGSESDRGLYIFNLASGKFLEKFEDLPYGQYGSQPQVMVSDTNPSVIAVMLNETWDSPCVVYAKAGEGSAFYRLDTCDDTNHRAFFYNGLFYYLKQGTLIQANLSNGEMREVLKSLNARGLVRVGNALFAVSDTQFSLYSLDDFSLINRQAHSYNLSQDWGYDLIGDTLVISATDTIVITFSSSSDPALSSETETSAAEPESQPEEASPTALAALLRSKPRHTLGSIEVYDLTFDVNIIDYPAWITSYEELLKLDRSVFTDTFLSASTGLTQEQLASLDDAQVGIVIKESLKYLLSGGESVRGLISDYSGYEQTADAQKDIQHDALLTATVDRIGSHGQTPLGNSDKNGLEYTVYAINHPTWIQDYIYLLSIDRDQFVDSFLDLSTSLPDETILSLNDDQKSEIVQAVMWYMVVQGEDVRQLLLNFTDNFGLGSAEELKAETESVETTPYQTQAEALNPSELEVPEMNYYPLKTIPGAEIVDSSRSGDAIYALHSRGGDDLYKLNTQTNTWELFLDGSGMNMRQVYADGDDVYVYRLEDILNVKTGGTITLPVNGELVTSVTDFCVRQNEIYVAVMPYHSEGDSLQYTGEIGAYGMYYSDDGGLTWQVRNDGLNNCYVNAVRISRDGRVFCAGWNGLYEYTGTQWEKLDNMRFPYISDLAIQYDQDGNAIRVFAACNECLLVHGLRQGGNLIRNYPTYIRGTSCIAISEDQTKLLIGHSFSGFTLWDAGTFTCEGTVLRNIPAHQAIFYNGGAILFTGSGYTGCRFYDLETGEANVFTEGLYSFPGLFSAIVDNGFIYSCSFIYDIANETFEPFWAPSMGEMFEIIKRDDYYTQDYDSGVWDLNGFDEITFVDIKPLPTYQQIYVQGGFGQGFGGSGFYITEAMDTAYIFSVKNEIMICVDWAKKTVKYYGQGLPALQYGSRPRMQVIEGEAEDILVLNYLLHWNESPVQYISYNSGRTFHEITEYTGDFQMDIIGCSGGVAYFSGERVLAYDTAAESWAVYSNTIRSAVYAGHGLLIAAEDNQVKVYDIESKTLLAVQTIDSGMEFVSASETERSISLVFSQAVLEVVYD